MTTGAISRRESLEAAVRDDPYAVGRIAELALLDISQDRENGAGSSRNLAALRKLAPQLHEVFANIADKRMPIHSERSLHILGERNEDLLASIVRAHAFVAEHYGHSDQALLIELALGKDVPTFTHSPDAAFSYVLIGKQRDGDLHAAMVHEFAHARFPTHNRYIDEGIAHFLEWKAQAVDAEAKRALLAKQWPSKLDLRTLLSYDATHDPYFSKLHPDGPCQVYGHAALLVSDLFDRRGPESLSALSDCLLENGGGKGAVECLERVFACEIGELEPLGRPDGGSAEVSDPLAKDFLARLTCALVALDEDRVANLERELALHSSEVSTCIAEELEAWCRIKLFELLSAVHEHCAEESKLLWVRGLVTRYEDSEHDRAVLANLKALLSIAEIPFAADEMAGLAHIGNVRLLFRQAMELAPGRVDAEYNLARFEMLAPDDVRAEKAEAREILRKLQRHRHLGSEIKRGVANSGWKELLVDP